jgi:hypothetical protein
MLGNWLERLETLATSWIGLAVVALVVVCQLLAVGAVASEQVHRSQARQETRQLERQVALRCWEGYGVSRGDRRPAAQQGCPQPRVIYVAHR